MGPGPVFFQDEEQFFALAIGGHYVHGFHAPQLFTDQGNIGHRRQFKQDAGAGGQQFRKQLKHIRLAVFQPKDLPSIRRPPGRVQEDHVRVEVPQNLGHAGRRSRVGARDEGGARNQGIVPDHNIIHTQLTEIVSRGLGQFGTHLVVQDLIEHLRKRTAIHAKSPGEVRDPAPEHRRGPICAREGILRGFEHRRGRICAREGNGGFVARRGGGGALLTGHAKRKDQRRHRVPLRHFVPELPPHLQRGQGQVKIRNLANIPGARKRQSSRILRRMSQYEFRKIHYCKSTE